MESNFDYLKESYPEIYKELCESERYFFHEELFLLKVRKALEKIFMKIDDESGYKESNGNLKHDGLLYKLMTKYLLEENEKREYHNLRKKCNDAIHNYIRKKENEEKRKDLTLLIELTKKLKNVKYIPREIEEKYLVITPVKEITKEVVKEVKKEVIKEVVIETIKEKERDYRDTIEDIFKIYENKEMPEDIVSGLYTIIDLGISKEEVDYSLKIFKGKYCVSFFSDKKYLKEIYINTILNDREKLNDLLEKSKSGNPIDLYRLGLYYLDIGEKEDGIKSLEKSAEDGFVQSLLKLGEIYEETDKKLSLSWYRKAMNLGSKIGKKKIEELIDEKREPQSILKKMYEKVRRKLWL